MNHASAPLRSRFDRLGIALSALCALHCLAAVSLVALFGIGGALLLDPAIHRVGLAIAVVIGAGAIGVGIARHRRGEPLLIGAVGVTLMGAALATGHGPAEAVLTTAGVALVALAHWRNLRLLAS